MGSIVHLWSKSETLQVISSCNVVVIPQSHMHLASTVPPHMEGLGLSLWEISFLSVYSRESRAVWRSRSEMKSYRVPKREAAKIKCFAVPTLSNVAGTVCGV